MDELLDGSRSLKTNTESRAHPLPNSAAAQLDQRGLYLVFGNPPQLVSVRKRSKCIERRGRRADSSDHNGGRQAANFVWRAPMLPISQRIRPHQKEQFGVASKARDVSQRVDGVAEPVSLNFEVRHDEWHMTADRKLEHSHAFQPVRQRLALLVRRPRSRNEPDLIQRTLLPAEFGQQKMPVMDGVERPAKDAQTHGTNHFLE